MAARTAVVAGTATAVSGRVQRRQARKYQEEQAPEPEPYQQQAVPEQRSAPDTSDKLEQLKSLGELKTQGVLTEAEFAAEKAKILAS